MNYLDYLLLGGVAKFESPWSKIKLFVGVGEKSAPVVLPSMTEEGKRRRAARRRASSDPEVSIEDLERDNDLRVREAQIQNFLNTYRPKVEFFRDDAGNDLEALGVPVYEGHLYPAGTTIATSLRNPSSGNVEQRAIIYGVTPAKNDTAYITPGYNDVLKLTKGYPYLSRRLFNIK